MKKAKGLWLVELLTLCLLGLLFILPAQPVAAAQTGSTEARVTFNEESSGIDSSLPEESSDSEAGASSEVTTGGESTNSEASSTSSVSASTGGTSGGSGSKGSGGIQTADANSAMPWLGVLLAGGLLLLLLTARKAKKI